MKAIKKRLTWAQNECINALEFQLLHDSMPYGREEHPYQPKSH